MAYQTSSRIDKIREFRGGPRSKKRKLHPGVSSLLFRALSRFAPRGESLREKEVGGGGDGEGGGEDEEKRGFQERKLERIFELEPPKRN